MEANVLMQFKDLGVAAALALSAFGSAMGTGSAGMAAVGAWKKCFARCVRRRAVIADDLRDDPDEQDRGGRR